MSIRKSFEKKKIFQKIVYWLPRVLGILFTLFISIFALDTFGREGLFLE